MGPILVAVVVVLLLVIVIRNIVVVQQSKAFVIERLGAFQAVWGVGLHFKLPFIDRIARRVSLKEQVLDYPPQPVITKDNVTAQGQVKLGAREWSARSTTGEVIPVGTLVSVDKVEGVKVYVTPVTVKV